MAILDDLLHHAAHAVIATQKARIVRAIADSVEKLRPLAAAMHAVHRQILWRRRHWTGITAITLPEFLETTAAAPARAAVRAGAEKPLSGERPPGDWKTGGPDLWPLGVPSTD